MEEKWFLQTKRADFYALGEKFHIDPVIARIIRNRNIITEEEFEQYLYGDLDSLQDPYLLKDAKKTVEILLQKQKQGKKVRIISDYDVDGIISNYILWKGMTNCGIDVDFKIPNRVLDGYGINKRLISEAKEDGIDTIITCDNGIAAIPEIAYAKELGLTVLVTDHHDIPYEFVDGRKEYLASVADAIVNPKQVDCSYPYDKLCGAAVAMKVMQILYQEMGFAPNAYEEFIPYCAIATVCDVVDLTKENRSLVRIGLQKLPYVENLGLQSLIELCGLSGKKITSYHLGFVIGPCMNATGRLESAEWAVSLLMESDPLKARALAQKLKDLNEARKQMTLDGVELGYHCIEEEGLDKDKVLVVFLPDCHESLAGIIAGRIRERYYKPTIVLTHSGEEVKGSGRSIEGYSMFEKLNEVKDLLLKFGGHPMAAGMSLLEENVDEFRRRLNKNANLSEEDLTKKILIDVPMPIDYIHETLIKQLDLLEPFGKENPKPIFAEKDLCIVSARKIGKNQNFLKLRLQNASGKSLDALLFQDVESFDARIESLYGSTAVNDMYSGRNQSIKVSCTYYPDINEYQGRTSIQIIIQNYKING